MHQLEKEAQIQWWKSDNYNPSFIIGSYGDTSYEGNIRGHNTIHQNWLKFQKLGLGMVPGNIV